MPRKHAAGTPMRFERMLLPEVETMVTIETTPHGACHLGHEDAKDRRMQLDADEHGMVRFHARPAKDAKPIELTLDCTDAHGRAVRHTVVLQPGMPASGTQQGGVNPAPVGTLRQPLAGDPMALSNQKLLARGYPPRPDPAKHPARYARWLKRVSQPFTQVTPTKVAHPGVRFTKRPSAMAVPPRLASPTLPLPPPMMPSPMIRSPMTRSMFNSSWNTWSGAYLTRPSSQFFWIEADWKVPGVFNFGNQLYSAAAEWIGLDNSGTDLYQSGTDSECWFNPFFGGWTITNYWMWIESLPFAPWGLPNFPLSPGDSVSVDIFVADENGMTWFQDGSNGGLTPADNSVWFMIYNYSKSLSYWGTLSTGRYSQDGYTSTGYTGSTAEFIIERPTDLDSGNPYPLAFFGLADMNSCYYADALYGDSPFRLEADGSTPFDGNLTYINMQDSATGNLLTIPISLPDPNSPGGYQILWIWANSV